MQRLISRSLIVLMITALCIPQGQVLAQDLHKLPGTAKTFASIPWGAKPSKIKAMLASNGYEYVKTDSDGDLHFIGKVEGVTTDVIELLTPSHQLVKTLVNIRTPDDDAIDFYQSMKDSLVQKYGNPSDSLEFYSDPYDDSDSDSDKQTAIEVGKGTLSTYWFYTDQSDVALDVSKRLTVEVTYESPQWSKDLARRKAAGSSVF